MPLGQQRLLAGQAELADRRGVEEAAVEPRPQAGLDRVFPTVDAAVVGIPVVPPAPDVRLVANGPAPPRYGNWSLAMGGCRVACQPASGRIAWKTPTVASSGSAVGTVADEQGIGQPALGKQVAEPGQHGPPKGLALRRAVHGSVGGRDLAAAGIADRDRG